MKSLLLVFCLFFASLAGASGSNTVFHKVNDYWITTDLDELSESSNLSPYLENLDRQIYVIKVNRTSWLNTAEQLRSGKQVWIQFGKNRPIAFYHDSRLRLVYGQTRAGDLVILDPCDAEMLGYLY